MFCCTLLYVHSSIAIILMGKRELIALLNLSSWCLMMVGRLFLAVPRGCLQFVIVVFPDHTHLLFLPPTCSIAIHMYYTHPNVLLPLTCTIATHMYYCHPHVLLLPFKCTIATHMYHLHPHVLLPLSCTVKPV